MVCAFFASLFLIYQHEERNFKSFQQTHHIELQAKASIEVERSERDAAVKNTELQRVLGNTAHDTKTPLQAMFNGAEELRSIVTEAAKQRSLELAGHPSTTTNRSGSIALLSDAQIDWDLLLERALQISTQFLTSAEFLNSAMNRSLDFSKAVNGITLQPNPAITKVKTVVEYCAFVVSKFHDAKNLICEVDFHYVSFSAIFLFSASPHFISVQFVNSTNCCEHLHMS